MATPIRIQALQALSLLEPFVDLDAAVLQRLAHHARSCRASRGEMLVQRGARADGMHVVVEGEVKLFLISPGGAEKIVRLVAAGDSFGE